MDDLAALRLLAEWGADEALDESPVDRFASRGPPVGSVPASVPGGWGVRPQAGPGGPPPPGPAPRTPAAPSGVPAQARLLAEGARTLDELHAALDAFEGCPLRAMATSTVRASGNPTAGLVLIAEAPGADDDRSGAAFSGAPGAMLDGILAGIGLDRSGVLLTHLVPWRPPGSRAPSEAEIAACLPFLHRLLALTAPRRLVLLGAAPVRALTGATDGIRRLRGRWLPVGGPGAVPELDMPAQALPVLPLEQWLRSPATKRDLWADLIQLRQSIDAAPEARKPL